MGSIFALLTMFCFGMAGILHKVADRKKCTPLMFTVVMFGSAAVIMSFNVTVFRGADFAPPAAVVLTALVFGVFAATAIWVFQHGIRFGKIATSWVIINLSAAVPTILSTVIYREKLGPGKILILSLIVIALLLLWKDKKEEEAMVTRAQPSSEGNVTDQHVVAGGSASLGRKGE